MYLLISNKHGLYLQQIVFASGAVAPCTVTKAFPQNPELHAVLALIQALVGVTAPGIIIQS